MFVFEGKGCEKILREAQEYEQEWLMRHSFLFCLSIAQTGSKLLLSLIPLQFPAAPSLKALNEIINILLCSLCTQHRLGSVTVMGRVRCNLCFGPNPTLPSKHGM